MSIRFSLRNTAAEISRARNIAEVLIRNGLGFLVEKAGLTRFIPRWRARHVQADTRTELLSVPERIRRTLEELGPTYIKLGQLLSTRPDILSPEYIAELSKLLDAAPPVPVDEIRQVIEQELGRSVEECFHSFSDAPLASASIGQVHRATLPDGTPVVVKVQRPGVDRVVQADLGLLTAQTRFLEGRSQAISRYHLVEIAEEFSQALRDELDYTIEGRNADRLRSLIDDLLIPIVYWERTTRRVITLSDLGGVTLSDIDRLKVERQDLGSIAERIVEAYLRQVFVHGVFHADPHPANILVCGDQIGLVDFGVIGHLSPRTKEDLGDLLLALVRQDADDLVSAITRMGAAERIADRRALRRDVQRLLARYYGASLESVPVAQLLADLLGTALKHQVRLPADLALLARTVVVLEGVALSLDPAFVLASHLEPFVLRLIRERLSVRRILAETVSAVRELGAVARVLPRRVDMLTEQLERGELTVGIDVRHLSRAMRTLDAIGNKVAFSVVVAAIIVGSALVLLSGEQSSLFRIPFTDIGLPIAQIGFVVSGLMGTWLLISIARSRGL